MHPEFTTQYNCEADLGILPRHFLRLARRGAFASVKVARVVSARREDVVAFFETRLQLAARAPANDVSGEAISLGRAGLRRVAT